MALRQRVGSCLGAAFREHRRTARRGLVLPCGRRNHHRRRAVAIGMTGHQITITPSGSHVEITLHGEKLAETDRAVLLAETGLPTRYYIPRQDVRTDLLRPTATRTRCPFKGQASYWSVQADGELHEDLVWSYETPIPEAAGITGLMCFYNERVEITVDGQRQPPRKAASFHQSADGGDR